MATAKELGTYIGRHGSIHLGKVVVNVRVTDARVRWGATQVEVVPVSGFGSQWVDASGVTFKGLLEEASRNQINQERR
jgi:hypothetical protein